MRVLGKIKAVCDARTWMSNGNPITIYPIIFEAGDNSFVGDMFKSADQLKRRGIANGAIGEMDIQFVVREARRSTGDTYPVQSVRFKDFYLANAGVFNENVEAVTEQPQPQPAEVLKQVNQEAEQAAKEGTDLPF